MAINTPDYSLIVEDLELGPSALMGINEWLNTEVRNPDSIAGQRGWNLIPGAEGAANIRTSVEDTDYCGTGLISRFSHLDKIGNKKRFVDEQDYKIYALGDPQPRNVFRLEVATLTADADNSDMEMKGRPDRVDIKMYQPNIHYTTSLILKVLEDSDNPLRLLRNRHLLDEKVAEIFDIKQAFSLVMSERFVTDSDGTITKDIVIPDNWLPAPIIVMVSYGYDRRTEVSGQELSTQVMEVWLNLFLEIWVNVAVCAFAPPLCWPYFWGDIARAVYILSEQVPMGGINNYGCWFGGGPLVATYVIDYKSDINKYGSLLTAAQQDFITQLENEKKQQDKNAQLWGGFMLAGVLAGLGIAITMGGK